MYGLVLEGGGAKGSYHVGAYKAILELGMDIGIIAGTSIGAVNGAGFAQGDYEKVYELWSNIKNSSVFDVEDKQIEKLKQFDIDKVSFEYFTNKVKNVILKGGLDTSVMRNLLENTLDEEKLRNSDIDFALVTVSVTDFKPMEIYIDDIPKGKLIDYVMASASFPGFKTGQIDGKIFIDGGIYNNLPINLVSNKGYNKIIAVRTYGVGVEKNFKLPENVEYIVIEPNEDLGKTLDFDDDVAKYNIKLGYYDAMKVLTKLSGKKYYIKNNISNDMFFKTLVEVDEDKIIRIMEYLGEKRNMEPRRYFFEILIPKLVNWLELDDDVSYKNIIIALYEILADYLQLERFKIYSYVDFKNFIEEELKKIKLIELDVVSNFMIQFDLLRQNKKEEMMVYIGRVLLDI